MIAEAGDAGNFFVTANRVDNDTINMESSGGSGIVGSSALNIMTGTITGKDAGEATFNSNDGDNFNVNWTANGGDGISGGINAGILTNVVVTSGDGGYLTISYQPLVLFLMLATGDLHYLVLHQEVIFLEYS